MAAPPPIDERERRALRIARDALDADDIDRDAFLARLCDGDAALRARVDALLQRIGASEDDGADDASAPPGDALVGTRLGPFRVRERLGRGGMGVVYRGTREDADFVQDVALKLIRRGFDFDDVHARFLRERRILARLSHPNLARFIDGGVAPDGRPWFALDYVRGEPITRWCDARRLGLRERVRLFLDVCAAVQYAHGQLVIHRDLKPANVLVDETGAVRLLDFGIARLLGGDEDAALTAVGGRYALTPEYAAPEQFGGGDVGVGADVYSLGVILFELLAGALPVPVERHDAGAAERSVRETPAQSLMHALAADPAAQEVRLAQRGSSLRSYRKRVRGDLSRIVGKALEKEPARRYGSVEAFASDLSRWLAGAPVRISGNGPGYRLGKFVARNRVAVALFLVASLALVLGSIGVWMSSREAVFEAARANAVQAYLTGLFESATPGGAVDEVPDVRELLARGGVRARTDFADQPRLRADMLGVLGHIHLRLGLHDEAEPLLAEAIALRRAAPDEDPGRLVDNLVDLARVARLRQRLPDARVLIDEALARVPPGDAVREANVRGLRGVVLALAGDTAEGEADLRRAVALSRAVEQPPGLRVAGALTSLGYVLDRANRLDEALAVHGEALALRRAAYDGVHDEISQSLGNIGEAQRRLGRLDQAEASLREAVAIDARVYDKPHNTRALRLATLAAVVGERGDVAGAEALIRESLRIREQLYGADDPRAARSRINLGVALVQQGRNADALDVLDVAQRIFAGAEGDWRTELAYVQQNRSRVLRNLGRFDAATAASRQSIALSTDLQGPDGPETLNAQAGLGRLLLATGHGDDALALLRDVLARSQRTLPPGHPRLADRHTDVADALRAQGRIDEARAEYAAALAIAEPRLGPTHDATLTVRLGLAATARQAGDAPALARELASLRAAVAGLPPGAPLRGRIERALAGSDD
ncbi:tetratricopeptide repeat protein [Chiayiivirga flava]|uniref:Serine/threonine-protein kinase n=1 Tax=Chiayiivirga flava TaxID=659595 RepID=A0A7W8D967_9GAMM|nr:tetratricopeptide repeat protein [Chiayiivirga flava]MBB5209085.1 serine/threonine-protein kinase [Chiayiivirga flava]